MKILLTGGHMSPALSVIEKLGKDNSLLVMGRKYTFEGDKTYSFEYKTFTELKIPFESITTGRLQRTFTIHTIPSLLKFPLGFFQSYKIVKKFKPDVILSFGGYISLPVVVSGFLLGVPIVIHEQTLGAGLANRVASIFATKICISWNSSQKFFPKFKTVLTGLPIKQFSTSNFSLKDFKKPAIFVTGGSTGSHTINLLIEKHLEKLLGKFFVIHQTGDSYFKDFERLNNLRENLNGNLKERYILKKFIDPLDFASVLKKADLVVSRCGINTVFELIYFEKIALLIPLNNEQDENARFMKYNKIAEIFSQNKPEEEFYDLLISMYSKINDYKKNSKTAKEGLVLRGDENVVKVLKSAVKNG